MVTTAKPKNSVGKTKPRRGEFSPDILERARKIAAGYEIVLWQEDDGWYGRGLELPLTMGDGKTPTECVKSTREALIVTVAYLIEKGEKPPIPVDDGERVEQVNIRLTRREKLLLEQTATRLGHRGLSDYLHDRVDQHGSRKIAPCAETETAAREVPEALAGRAELNH